MFYKVEYISTHTCLHKNKSYLIILSYKADTQPGYLFWTPPSLNHCTLQSVIQLPLPLLQMQTQNFPSTSNWKISQSSRDCAVGSLARFHFVVHRWEGCEYKRRSTTNKATRGQICLQLRYVHVFLRPLEIHTF